MLRIEDVMTSVVTCAFVDSSLEDIERIMQKQDLKCLPIIERDGGYLGVITTSGVSLCRCLGVDADTDKSSWLPIEEALSLPPNVSLMHAVEVMVSRNAHYIIVVESGQIRGIVSAIDVLGTLMREGKTIFAKHLFI